MKILENIFKKNKQEYWSSNQLHQIFCKVNKSNIKKIILFFELSTFQKPPHQNLQAGEYQSDDIYTSKEKATPM